MIVLDANVWVSMMTQTEPNHRASDTWLASWLGAQGRLVVPELFLVEVAGTIARNRKDSAAGLRTLRDLQSEPGLEVAPLTPSTWTDAAELAARHRLRGADAVYVALALHEALPLVTWDRTVLTNAAGIVDVRTPDQVPI